MKKFLVVLFLSAFFMIAFGFFKTINAACDFVRDGNTNMCLNHWVDCSTLTGSPACCDTANECSSSPTPSPLSTPVPFSGCIETAVGCIDVSSPTPFIKSILGLAIGIGGGIAFLLMILGAFYILTSTGDPNRLQAGKEMIGSALAGLLMIIFSVFLLQLIGVQILEIPGFSK